MKLNYPGGIFASLVSFQVWASGEHSHGAGGELEHALPIIGVLAGITLIGAAIFFMSKKKK